MAPPPPIAGVEGLRFTLTPSEVISISRTPGFSVEGSSPTQRKRPPTFLVIARYSRLARTQGGSESSSLIGLLLAITIAPERAWPSACFASSLTCASSPLSLQLSLERVCQEQWCGVSIRSYWSQSL